MRYRFSNLVFEGGGVKGIAYVGALEELDARNILNRIQRVGGTSAGAIVAVLVGLGYGCEEIKKILWELDFRNFLDGSWGIIRDFKRLKDSFGWYKGDLFRRWIGDIIAKKTGNPNSTFAEIERMRTRKNRFRGLYFMITNLSTRYSEVMSAEKYPGVCVADAVRFSMSIPFFFAAKRGIRGDLYVDGGVLDNYPVKLFDRERYLARPGNGLETGYYAKENETFLKKHPSSSPYVYNKETLGFRLDSREEIAMFRDQAEPPVLDIDDLFDFIAAVVRTYMDSQDNQHLHSDDWQRTIYIDTLGVGTTQFDIADAAKQALLESGRSGVRNYFTWYDDRGTEAANK